MVAKAKSPLLTLADVQQLPTVPPSGPCPAHIAFVGEAPAREEMREGMPFVGPSGDILWQWVKRHLGLDRNRVWTGNLLPFQVPEKKGKDLDEILAPEVLGHYEDVLRAELEMQVRPAYILTLGAWSTRALLGDGVQMEWAHGLPFRCSLGTVIPVYHPAAGIHSSDRLQYTNFDLKYAGKVIAAGRDGPPSAPLPMKRYRVLTRDAVLPKADVFIDTEGSSEHPYCLTLSTAPNEAYLIRADDGDTLRAFEFWLSVHKPVVWLHNALHDLRVLRAMGLDLFAIGCHVSDTMAAAHVLQDVPKGLKPLARRLLDHKMHDYIDVVWSVQEGQRKGWLELAKHHPWPEPGKRKRTITSRIDTLVKKSGHRFRLAWNAWELMDKLVGTVGPPPEVDYDRVPGFKQYAMQDADETGQVKRRLLERVVEEGLMAPLDLDNRVLPFLDNVMTTGLYCDLEKLIVFHAEIQQRKAHITDVIRALVGDESFNPASADQVEKQLIPYLTKLAAEGRVKLTRTKKRWKVDDGVLKQIRDEDPLVPAVLEFRELDKLDGTYLRPLYGFLQYDKESELFRLPLNLKHCTVVTGRLSAQNPNVLAWPARTADGLRLRDCFLAPPGWKMGSWDLSQIELRLAAGFSGDPVMLEAFRAGRDLHQEAAARFFAVPYDRVDKATQRTPIKTAAYLQLYGGGADGLFVQLLAMGVKGFTRMRCQEVIDGWWGIHHVLAAYVRNQAYKTRSKGYAETWLGRRRYLPGTTLMGRRWPCAKLREEAERQGFSQEIQGGAQDLLKRAEVRTMEVKRDLNQIGIGFEPCLQIHDEILALVKEGDWEITDSFMRAAMVADEGLVAVPLDCTGQIAGSWGGLKG